MTTPLPEQGGFNERLDAILEEFDHDRDYLQTKAAIRTLIAEEIIGEDEKSVGGYDMPGDRVNRLKAEQRKRLGFTANKEDGGE